MAIVIKKRVSLEFLGEEYKEAYLVFKSIPALEFQAVADSLDKLDPNSSIGGIVKVLEDYFLEGEFPSDGKLEPVSKEDIGQLDPLSLTQCFKIFTGQDDPKVETPLTNSSPTAESLPTNS